MPKGTPHPELLLEEYGAAVIGPKGVFTDGQSGQEVLERWLAEGFLEGSFVICRMLDQPMADLLVKGHVKEVYAGQITPEAYDCLARNSVPFQYRIKD